MHTPIQRILLITLLVGTSLQSIAQNNTIPSQQPEEPRVLHPGTFSNDLPQWNNYFNRKLSIGICTRLVDGKSKIIVYPYVNEKFEKGFFLPFDEKFNYSDPWMNIEGDYMLLQANIGVDGNPIDDFGICESRYIDGQWTQPEPLPNINKLKGNEGSPSLAHSGNLYFNAQNGNQGYDIFVLKKGETQPIALPEAINSKYFEGDFYVDREEQFIVFSSSDRPDGKGETDIYISFFDNGKWTQAKAFERGINTDADEFSPYISMDRTKLIFTSNRNNPFSLIPTYNHFIIEIDLENIRSHFGD
ncbi:MAG TPA: hypothetical protein VIN11_01260 [Roseivirga sp.]